MIGPLIRVRFRALIAGMTAQARKKGSSSIGTAVLFGLLFTYVGVVILGLFGSVFLQLANPYYAMGFSWLYFAIAGLMGLAFAVLGSVFTTQSQLYDAKDNALLLSMPIPPWGILLSRMVPLLVLNLLYGGLVMVPAIVVYAIKIHFSLGLVLVQLLSLLAVALLAQAISCALGWLLHLLLSKINKSVASLLYMVVFLGAYFYLYSQASSLLTALAANAEGIAGVFSSWVWPMWAMGMGCTGQVLPMLGFLAICCVLFAAVWWVLSATFLRTASAGGKSRKRRKGSWKASKVRSPFRAILGKEARKFLGTPVYLTNMGMGVVMTAAVALAGLIFRSQILPVLQLMEIPGPVISLIVCAVVLFSSSTIAVSCPSVSLEGKSIWLLKSLPLTGQQILRAKLGFHCLLSVPVSGLTALMLTLAFGGTILESLLSALVCGIGGLLCGLIGLAAGLRWARLDYISEAYPCKQSVAVLVTMFSMMGVPLVFGLLYGLFLSAFLSPTAFLSLSAPALAAICFGLYRLIMGWGVRKWDTL